MKAIPLELQSQRRKPHQKRKPLELYYHAMLLPGIVLLFIFSIVPMFGLIMAFEKYMPAKGILGSSFVGLKNFQTLLMFQDARQVLFNTVIIAVAKIVLNLAVPIAFALLLNECRVQWFKRSVQTIVYAPNFLSWVITAAIFTQVFSFTGPVNALLKALGLQEPIMFMISNTWFRPLLVLTDVWKNFGFGAIVYITAITSIDPFLYEAAEVDGAGRWQKMRYITFPGILPTVIIMATLSLGNVLNAGFDQVFNMYNACVYQTGDILDTYVYRIGLVNMQYSLGTAVGLIKSVISCILIVTAYRLADKYAGYKIL
jgi:putative aldouronate transport system permease protein